MRTAVVLPAPFGPSSPKTLPASTLEVDAAEGLDVAVALAQAGGLDGGLGRHPLYASGCAGLAAHPLTGGCVECCNRAIRSG